MTTAELLAATGNMWEVKCYRDGNRRRFDRCCYVRAADVLRAEQAAKEESGCNVADAKPYDPRRDRSVIDFVLEVQ